MIQRNEADGGHDPDADRVELLIAQAERRGKEPGQQHDRQVRQAARHGPPNDIAHEFALHARVIRLQREENRRDTDGKRADERQLDRQQRIGHVDEQQQERQRKRENILHEEQRGRALDVIDDAAALRHDGWHRTELGIEQHDLCNLRGSLTAGGHGDSAVGILQRQHVIDAVARHGDRMALLLEGADKIALLLRCDAAEDGVILDSLLEVLLRGEGHCIDITIGILNAGTGRDLRDRDRVIARDNTDRHALTGKIAERLLRVGAQQV